MKGIQAIMFDNNKFDTKTAREWLKKHKYYPIKPVHVTKKFFRYRLKRPRQGAKYVNIEFGKNKGIFAIYMIDE